MELQRSAFLGGEGWLEVRLVQCRSLPRMDVVTLTDAFCVLQLGAPTYLPRDAAMHMDMRTDAVETKMVSERAAQRASERERVRADAQRPCLAVAATPI